ncbi:hypothetical protein CO112_03975 [Candidatus Dojkabacteria bacterium CG_4_9_14_3_um_filter_150_Dojkabacteria_WS6_41_13]|uniref:DUF3558 domain-containing protein n=1 Tax=Candidatus Dojkabacteria bacterium CG_4_10_14_0_2_um_filter_Dojkabacteria_WS6_41_15 TaxID=2014249 RepID=A0A2M7W2K9_9BACT|nr:MAG: hypothetical protein COZ14_02825 [Candidatus Dojkabacteria bacterium CG_4_10_14_3_um_filter_Dojkabacteria_WS6_41_9]PJA15008.1 MAG: hypothetical protein COX64_01300 [Candidatus Dojkabacteria bacterium CG_4_10_14_0_2_um_filter_Dojkabacteria_WS6_41_15]PJB22468.1 MAG: hypothetical protein CO112_03975 [Candidatus Dojkabacteria bacterium CG_4_9_14_3_um_filter_150_Dojkabacteria_WS6_41_13]
MNKKIVMVAALVGIVAIASGVFFLQGKKAKKTTDDKTGAETTSPTATGSETTSSKACDLLTLEIAETIFKDKAKTTDNNSSTACTYTSQKEDLTSFGIITLVDSNVGVLQARESFETAKTAIYGSSTEAVTGLDADAAYYAPTLKQLSILKGGHWIIITALTDSYPTDKDASIATAKLVLARIK